jgi:DNA helicase-2/ATP-dependent DNA helicase PcrA
VTLDPHQQEAVDHPAARLVLLAGAGAGKTRVLVARIVRLLHTAHPSEFVVLTFTRAAAAEMRERILGAVQAAGLCSHLGMGQMFFGTFHAWAAALLREYHDVIGLPHRFVLRDEADREDLIRFVGRELGLSRIKSVAGLWKRDDVRARYRVLTREAAAVDFDELEAGACAVLAQRGAELRRRWRYVVCDEHQDVSALQQRALDLLDAGNMLVVGDGGQAIYSFRGGESTHLEGLTRRPGWHTLTLHANYRCPAPVVGVANRIAARMTPPGIEQTAAPRDAAPVEVADLEDLARLLPSAVHADHVVLAPTWALAERAACILEDGGVPAVVARKRQDALDSEEARWIVNALRITANPNDNMALWAFLTAFDPRRLTMAEWAGARALAAKRGESVLDCLPVGVQRGILAPLLAWDGRRAGVDPVYGQVPLIRAPFWLSTLADELTRLHLLGRVGSLHDAAAALGDLVSDPRRAGPEAALRPATVEELLDAYSSRRIADPDPQDAVEAVRCMTIHAAKGLEFPHVYVVGLDAGVFPRGNAGPEAIEEARRLLYVAVTRAKERCWLLGSATVARSGFVDEAMVEGVQGG